MDTNLIIGIVFGALVTQGINHLLTKSRERQKHNSEIGNIFLNEIDTIVEEMLIPRSFSSPLEYVGFCSRNKLSTVNYVAFLKTCGSRQRAEIEMAYQAYGKSENKYESLVHLKTLVEKIINER